MSKTSKRGKALQRTAVAVRSSAVVRPCVANTGDDEDCGKPSTATVWEQGVALRVCKQHAEEAWVKGYSVVSDRPNDRTELRLPGSAAAMTPKI